MRHKRGLSRTLASLDRMIFALLQNVQRFSATESRSPPSLHYTEQFPINQMCCGPVSLEQVANGSQDKRNSGEMVETMKKGTTKKERSYQRGERTFNFSLLTQECSTTCSPLQRPPQGARYRSRSTFFFPVGFFPGVSHSKIDSPFQS